MNWNAIQDAASEARKCLVTGERESTETGRKIIASDRDNPAWGAWVQALVMAAHADSDSESAMLPDDFRYEMIEEVLGAIEDNDEDVAREALEELPSVYTAERFRWLASHSWRRNYVEDAESEWGKDGALQDRIALGMVQEYGHIFERLVQGLTEHIEEAEESAEMLPGED